MAGQAGMSVQAVRFYEHAGLLPKPQRTPSGYRAYSPGDLHRLQLIRQAKGLGFSLEEIKRILKLRARGSCPCGEVVSTLERHLSDVDCQIRRLKQFRKFIASTLAEWKRSGTDAVPGEIICGLIERTMKNGKGSQLDIKQT